MDYGLGYSLASEDLESLKRNHTELPFSSSDFEPPEEVDPRSFTKVKNQGQIGSCGGNSSASGAEIINFRLTNVYKVFSAMFCYLEGQKIFGNLGRDGGTSISSVVQSLIDNGVPEEIYFPYPDHYISTIPTIAVDKAKENKIQKQSSMKDHETCFAWLASNLGTIEIGVHWYQSMANCTGVLESIVKDTYLGDHAMQLVGYSKRKKANRNYLWLLNSHSTRWGNQGFAEVSPDVIDYWFGVGSIMVGMTDLTVLKPRKFTWSDAL